MREGRKASRPRVGQVQGLLASCTSDSRRLPLAPRGQTKTTNPSMLWAEHRRVPDAGERAGRQMKDAAGTERHFPLGTGEAPLPADSHRRTPAPPASRSARPLKTRPPRRSKGAARDSADMSARVQTVAPPAAGTSGDVTAPRLPDVIGPRHPSFLGAAVPGTSLGGTRRAGRLGPR